MRGRAEGGVGGRSGHRLGRCGLAPEHPLFRTPASQHQQQVLQAVERAKQVTVGELNSLIGVSHPGPCPGGGRPHPRSSRCQSWGCWAARLPWRRQACPCGRPLCPVCRRLWPGVSPGTAGPRPTLPPL